MLVRKIQFEDENAVRKYPFSENATLVSDTGDKLPYNILVGASAVCLAGAGTPFVSSVYIGVELISVTVTIENAGTAAISIPKSSMIAYKPYELRPVSGKSFTCILSFGDFQWAQSNASSITYRFSSATQSGLSESCCTFIRKAPVFEFIDDKTNERLSGDVIFKSNRNVLAKMSISQEGFRCLDLSLTESGKELVSSDCDVYNPSKSCGTPPITSINGILPDDDGNINIVLK